MAELTEMQIKTLGLLARGYSLGQAALKLGVKVYTVKNCLYMKKAYGQSSGILEKLMVPSATAAIIIALQHGWLKLNELDVLTTESPV